MRQLRFYPETNTDVQLFLKATIRTQYKPDFFINGYYVWRDEDGIDKVTSIQIALLAIFKRDGISGKLDFENETFTRTPEDIT